MHFEEKPPNHERWIISYADFTTLLLATFVVMYAVSSINSSKFQEMAEAFSTAFIGRTVTLDSTGLAAENKSPFDFMPSPVHVPIITREPQIKNLPVALRQEQPKRQEPSSEEESKAESKTKPPTLKRGQFRASMPVGDLGGRADATLEEAYRKLEKALAALIGKGEVKVQLRDLGVVIDINEVLLFHNGKAELMPPALPLIDKVASILKDLPYQIQVNGFTDNKPIHNATFDSNWDLSASRAISVVKRFVAGGVDPTLVVGAGYGEFHPVASNDTIAGRSSNRRVSIVVVSPLADENGARATLVGPDKHSVTKPEQTGPAVLPIAGPAPPATPEAALGSQPSPTDATKASPTR